MFQFIVTNILMLSLGTVLYIVVRTLPRIQDDGTTEKKGVLERWIASEIPEKIDRALNGFLFKFLRKTKVILLKADNSVSEQLKKIKPEGANGKTPAIDFKEIMGQNKNGESAENKT